MARTCDRAKGGSWVRGVTVWESLRMPGGTRPRPSGRMRQPSFSWRWSSHRPQRRPTGRYASRRIGREAHLAIGIRSNSPHQDSFQPVQLDSKCVPDVVAQLFGRRDTSDICRGCFARMHQDVLLLYWLPVEIVRGGRALQLQAALNWSLTIAEMPMCPESTGPSDSCALLVFG